MTATLTVLFRTRYYNAELSSMCRPMQDYENEASHIYVVLYDCMPIEAFSHHLQVPMGSPSRGGDATAYV